MFLSYYPYEQMAFTQYVLSGTEHTLSYSFTHTADTAEYIPPAQIGTIQFTCGLQSFAYDAEENREIYYNFILLYHDTGALEDAVLTHAIAPVQFLYMIHKSLHILEVPFDYPLYDTYNLYYIKKKNKEVARLRFNLQTGQLLLENETAVDSQQWETHPLRPWFSMNPKDRIAFAQSYYTFLRKHG